jgi:hypothetical protein
MVGGAKSGIRRHQGHHQTTQCDFKFNSVNKFISRFGEETNKKGFSRINGTIFDVKKDFSLFFMGEG